MPSLQPYGLKQPGDSWRTFFNWRNRNEGRRICYLFPSTTSPIYMRSSYDSNFHTKSEVSLSDSLWVRSTHFYQKCLCTGIGHPFTFICHRLSLLQSTYPRRWAQWLQYSGHLGLVGCWPNTGKSRCPRAGCCWWRWRHWWLALSLQTPLARRTGVHHQKSDPPGK